MRLMTALLLCFGIPTLAASKVVEKTRVLEEKISSAEGCTISGDYISDDYSAQYLYTVTMKITVLQMIEPYSAKVTRSLIGKTLETEIPNSVKPAREKTVASVQKMTHPVRYPTEQVKQSLLKSCEDEMLFINTGSYPPPPPRPVIIEKPKKTPPAKSESPDDPSTLPTEPAPPSEGDLLIPPSTNEENNPLGDLPSATPIAN
ncbi:MAG: hypothetical protein JNL11_02845 [Bdellovibrionaceae bacterium]|nr:hypothetical protein [Pseudobdellovibrionaceae bacterium]